MIVRGTTETRDELTGNFGSALEDTSISDYRLIALFAEKTLNAIFGVLQHYRSIRRTPDLRIARSQHGLRCVSPRPFRLDPEAISCRNLQQSFDPRSLKKCFGHDGGWLKKNRDSLGFFAPFRCFVGSDRALPPERRWGNAHVRALINMLCVMSPNNCLQCAT